MVEVSFRLKLNHQSSPSWPSWSISSITITTTTVVMPPCQIVILLTLLWWWTFNPQRTLTGKCKIYRGEEILQTGKVGKTFSLGKGQTAHALHWWIHFSNSVDPKEPFFTVFWVFCRVWRWIFFPLWLHTYIGAFHPSRFLTIHPVHFARTMFITYPLRKTFSRVDFWIGFIFSLLSHLILVSSDDVDCSRSFRATNRVKQVVGSFEFVVTYVVHERVCS